jgi:hypothetical protein
MEGRIDMWLKKIDFSRWREKEPLSGSIAFEGESGSIVMKLQEQEIADLVKAMAGVLVRHAQATSKRLELEAVNTGRILIEAKQEGTQ